MPCIVFARHSLAFLSDFFTTFIPFRKLYTRELFLFCAVIKKMLFILSLICLFVRKGRLQPKKTAHPPYLPPSWQSLTGCRIPVQSRNSSITEKYPGSHVSGFAWRPVHRSCRRTTNGWQKQCPGSLKCFCKKNKTCSTKLPRLYESYNP